MNAVLQLCNESIESRTERPKRNKIRVLLFNTSLNEIKDRIRAVKMGICEYFIYIRHFSTQIDRVML